MATTKYIKQFMATYNAGQNLLRDIDITEETRVGIVDGRLAFVADTNAGTYKKLKTVKAAQKKTFAYLKAKKAGK